MASLRGTFWQNLHIFRLKIWKPTQFITARAKFGEKRHISLNFSFFLNDEFEALNHQCNGEITINTLKSIKVSLNRIYSIPSNRSLSTSYLMETLNQRFPKRHLDNSCGNLVHFSLHSDFGSTQLFRKPRAFVAR